MTYIPLMNNDKNLTTVVVVVVVLIILAALAWWWFQNRSAVVPTDSTQLPVDGSVVPAPPTDGQIPAGEIIPAPEIPVSGDQVPEAQPVQ